MKRKIKEVIRRVFYEGDHQYYQDQQRKKLDLFPEIEIFLQEKNIKTTLRWPDRPASSLDWIFDFGEYRSGDYMTSFETVLSISKIVEAYNMCHAFEVSNLTPQAFTKTINGSDQMHGFTYPQVELNFHIKKVMKAYGYVRLDYQDMFEKVPRLRFPHKGRNILGKYIDVDNILFADAMGIGVPDEEDGSLDKLHSFFEQMGFKKKKE